MGVNIWLYVLFLNHCKYEHPLWPNDQLVNNTLSTRTWGKNWVRANLIYSVSTQSVGISVSLQNLKTILDGSILLP